MFSSEIFSNFDKNLEFSTVPSRQNSIRAGTSCSSSATTGGSTLRELSLPDFLKHDISRNYFGSGFHVDTSIGFSKFCVFFKHSLTTCYNQFAFFFFTYQIPALRSMTAKMTSAGRATKENMNVVRPDSGT